MKIREALARHLTSHGEVAALAGDRIYPLALPQNPTYPAVVFTRVGSDPQYAHSGFSSLTVDRFQVDAVARTPAETEALAAAIRLALDAAQFPATMPDDSGVRVDSVFVEGGAEGYEDELMVYTVTQDIVITHAG